MCLVFRETAWRKMCMFLNDEIFVDGQAFIITFGQVLDRSNCEPIQDLRSAAQPMVFSLMLANLDSALTVLFWAGFMHVSK